MLRCSFIYIICCYILLFICSIYELVCSSLILSTQLIKKHAAYDSCKDDAWDPIPSKQPTFTATSYKLSVTFQGFFTVGRIAICNHELLVYPSGLTLSVSLRPAYRAFSLTNDLIDVARKTPFSEVRDSWACAAVWKFTVIDAAVTCYKSDGKFRSISFYCW